MGELLVFADRRLVVERPEPDEPRRELGLVRQDREAAVDLHRVCGNKLHRNAPRDLLRDGALPRGRRAEDRDHGHRSRARASSSSSSATPAARRYSSTLPYRRSSSAKTCTIDSGGHWAIRFSRSSSASLSAASNHLSCRGRKRSSL